MHQWRHSRDRLGVNPRLKRYLHRISWVLSDQQYSGGIFQRHCSFLEAVPIYLRRVVLNPMRLQQVGEIKQQCGIFVQPKRLPHQARRMNSANSANSEPSLLARCLGYAGLVPFALLAVLLWLVPADAQAFVHKLVATALVGYGAVIASFLGGVHWGMAGQLPPHTARFHYVWGVVPSLLGWVAVAVPAATGLPLLGLVLATCYVVDLRSYPRVGWSAWLSMRLQLTAVAVLSCVLGAAKV
jgi:Protein of unknown function (DUF3429)